jgi:hypothetical protein
MIRQMPLRSFSEGETWYFEFILFGLTGVAADAGDLAEVEWGLAKNLTDVPPPKGLVTMTGGGIAIIGLPADGRLSITSHPADRIGVTPGDWFHQCRATFIGGLIVEQFTGPVPVAESIFV